jgi:hypothetical protein
MVYGMALGTMGDITGSVLHATPHTIFTVITIFRKRCTLLF